MYYLGIDVSTTATKALLIDAAGKVISVAASEYTFETPHPLWSEQSPGVWWAGSQNAIRSLLQQAQVSPSQIGALGLTGQMHGLVLLDAQGEVLRPCILWNDQRTQSQCDEIHRLLGRENFLQITGNPALTGFTLPKLLWVKENEPQIFARIAHVLLPKDYLRYRLTGTFAMDRSDGSGTVLMDLRARAWSQEIIKAVDIPSGWLPPLFDGPEITGWISAEAAQATGLRPGTPLVAGGGDQAATAVGVGAVREGIVSLALGTSGVVFATTNHPFIESEGRLHAFCHSIPGRWHLMGVMLSAAGSLRWYRDTFSPQMSYESLLASCAEIPAGAGGLLFLPYLTGERTPYPDPLARGAFVGLTIRHSLPHLTRAVLEGVAFGLRDSFELMRASGLDKIEQVRASGGGARSRLWLQILANAFPAELVTVSTSEGAAYGAALLAGVGVGAWQDIDSACEQAVQVTSRVSPVPSQVGLYDRIYLNYRNLYPALKPTFTALA